MEIEYLVAIAIFVAVFSFVVVIVSGNILDQKELINQDLAKVQADIMMDRIEDDPDVKLLSPAYRVYSYAKNENSTVDELIQIDLSDYGGGDVDSVVAMDDKGNIYDTVSSGQVVAFSSEILSGSTKRFVIYFDDDSDFPVRSGDVSGNDTIQETLYGPEKIIVVQHKLVQKMKQRNATNADNFKIIVEDYNGTKILDYGSVPERKSVVFRKKPVVIQLSNAMLVPGWIRIGSW